MPSLSDTPESGLANTRQLSIRRRNSAMDQASSRPSGNLFARNKGNPTRCSLKGRSCRVESRVSARRRQECRNPSDPPPAFSRWPKISSASSNRSWSSCGADGGSSRVRPNGTGNNPSPIAPPAASSTTACWLSTGVSTSHALGSAPHRLRHALRNSSRDSREAERRVVWASAPSPTRPASHRATATARISPLQASGPRTWRTTPFDPPQRLRGPERIDRNAAQQALEPVVGPVVEFAGKAGSVIVDELDVVRAFVARGDEPGADEFRRLAPLRD